MAAVPRDTVVAWEESTRIDTLFFYSSTHNKHDKITLKSIGTYHQFSARNTKLYTDDTQVLYLPIANFIMFYCEKIIFNNKSDRRY